ncbi:carbohydrate-binding protein [Gilvimarinus agarilyticus]|uniref:carbohydrate-binding protein n=1 Tax=Gilvimarinus agarilyticus TaxID=679259 RepID=UPI0006976CF1|nr:carbohydrate-binding protein [Gilvimarinus agarilyticus]
MKKFNKGLISLAVGLTLSSGSTAQSYTDTTPYELVNADNGGKVQLRDAPGGSGDINAIMNLINSARLPDGLHRSRLSTGAYASNIAQTQAVQQTLQRLASDRPETYTGTGTVVTSENLEQHRSAIESSGGTFVFRGTIPITGKDKLIQVGENTTVWVDGNVIYTGPVIAGTVPDEYSVSDVVNGVFEVRGSNSKATQNVKIFGTKRGIIQGNNRLSGVYVRYAKNLTIKGLNTDRCRNVLFLNNVYGDSVVNGNFVYNSSRRAVHVKASNGITVENNLIVDAEVDGIDIDAYTKNSNTLRNVLLDAGSRFMVWTEIASVDNVIDGNVGIHVNDSDGGFQENGSESNGQPPTARNQWLNNHIFYADSSSNWKQGFSFHPHRVIDRGSVTFANNYVWQSDDGAYKRNPKPDTTKDVSYYRYVGASPVDSQMPYVIHTLPGLIEAENFDEGGAADVDTTISNLGGSYRQNSSVDIQPVADTTGEFNVGWIADGERLDYTISSVTQGVYDIHVRVAAPGNSDGKAIEFSLNGVSLGSTEIMATGGWQKWQTITLNRVELAAGNNQTLRLIMKGGDFNLNWIEFVPSQNEAPSSFSVEAEAFYRTGGPTEGFQTYTTGDNIGAINFNQRGDWADYQVDVPEAGDYQLQAWLGTTQNGGAIEILIDGVSYLKQTVPNNGSWNEFSPLSPEAPIPFAGGAHTIRVQSSGNSESTWEWNADRFVFTRHK